MVMVKQPLSSQFVPLASLDFVLPPELEASEPPEERGLARDEVRLMVSYRSDNRVVHTQFRQITEFLEPGDLVVLNTSGTMQAAFNALRGDGTALELHLSTHLPADLWVVEVRQPGEKATKPFYQMQSSETLLLPDGATVQLHVPYLTQQRAHVQQNTRLWLATLHLPYGFEAYMEQYGFPIRYSYVRQGWPISYYQTVFATERGSAEMPSAGRAFTAELLTQLIARGVRIAPLLLHTGVASLEEHEPPYEEYYRVPAETAELVNLTKASGRRVVAVGTTVVRALETVTDERGIAHPGEGWTRLVIAPQRGIRVIDALLTGLHEPRASHLLMLEALSGRAHLQLAYTEALQQGYLWHEFGDLHLLLP